MKNLPVLTLLLGFSLPVLTSLAPAAAPSAKPNILWITSEDHGPQMGCYGDPEAITPHVDALAAKGMLFRHAWAGAPVCAPSRTTLISGMYAASTGSADMRSLVAFPAGQKMFPSYLREAGYYCTNRSKEDYNLAKPGVVWDESSPQAHYKNRTAAAQPFFAVLNAEGSHESKLRIRPHTAVHDPAKVRVPAYHPDTPEVRQDWAQYYDTVTAVDAIAGRHLDELEQSGLAPQTIVFYFADHGSGMPRSKRWPGNSGLQVPVVVYFPEKWRHLAPAEYQPGGKSDRLIHFVDFAPTMLSLAGVPVPAAMQGHAFAGPDQNNGQPYLHGYRDRMDERIDLVRSVTDGRFVYLRNFMPHLPAGQHIDFQFQTPTTSVWHRLFEAGKLNEAQSRFWKTPREPEELYDLSVDPDEVNNLASVPGHQATLTKMRDASAAQARRIRDTGFLPEGERIARAAPNATYDFAQDPARYPFDRIFAAAGLASNLSPGAIPELRQLTTDPDSAVRYWATLGLVALGESAINAATAELQKCLEDTSPYVRIHAAWALASFPLDAASASAAVNQLGDLVSMKQNNSFISFAALTAIDQLGFRAIGLKDAAASWQVNGPFPHNRYSNYPPALKNSILNRFGLAAQPARKAAGKKR